MKLQDAKHTAMLSQWQEMVHRCRGSGQTVAAWCRENNIPVATYYRRQRLVWEHASRALPEKVSRQQALQPAPTGGISMSCWKISCRGMDVSEKTVRKYR